MSLIKIKIRLALLKIGLRHFCPENAGYNKNTEP